MRVLFIGPKSSGKRSLAYRLYTGRQLTSFMSIKKLPEYDYNDIHIHCSDNFPINREECSNYDLIVVIVNKEEEDNWTIALKEYSKTYHPNILIVFSMFSCYGIPPRQSISYINKKYECIVLTCDICVPGEINKEYGINEIDEFIRFKAICMDNNTCCCNIT